MLKTEIPIEMFAIENLEMLVVLLTILLWMQMLVGGQQIILFKLYLMLMSQIEKTF